MRTISVEEFRDHPDQYLAETAQGDVVLTQDGQPWVVLRAVDDDQDRLSAAYANSPEFRHMIQQRRQEQGIPWDEARQQLDLEG
jgi:antitoxin (DNA-binding transcriptional repressor) of toxin-antitoxin stability system